MAAAWTNWSCELRCEPAVLVAPRSTDEVAAAVREAAARGHVVRVAGSGHSFTPLVLTDGTLLRLDAMDRVLHVDAARGRARVQAGITLHALSRALDAHGVALPNLGDIDAQCLAGAIATATHGTGAALRTVSAQVTALQVVDGAGTVRELDAGDELLAGQVALGALGVVTEVELAVVPAFTLRRHDGPVDRAAGLAALDELAAAHEHVELFLFPYARRAIACRTDRVDEPPRPARRVGAWVRDVLLENHVLGAGMALTRRVPRSAPRVAQALAAGAGDRVRVDRSFRVLATERRVRFTELEYAVPRAAGREVAEAVLRLVERERLPIAFPLELRLVAGDDALLSPAHGRETAYVAAHVAAGAPYERFLREVEAIARAHDGRPHWGKRHWRTAADLAPAYPGWARFAAVRARLDPGGRFVNAHLREVLGVAVAPAAADH